MSVGPLRRQLESLINGFDFYNRRERMQADDLLVRQKARASLARAEERLRAVEAAWRTDNLPDPISGTALPAPAALAPLRRLEALRTRLHDTDTLLGAAPLAPADRTWARLQDQGGLLELLLERDLTLVNAAEGVLRAAAAATATDIPASLAPVETALTALDAAIRDRAADLSPPL